MTRFQEMLFELKDDDYQKFQAKLIPTLPPEKIIGVRVPQLRELAKEIWKDLGEDSSSSELKSFFETLPHEYYEENLLHSFLIEKIKDFDDCLSHFEKFLPYIDNWAVCDTCHPKVFKKNCEKLLPKIYGWIESGKLYSIRYGVDSLMTYFLDDKFDVSYLEKVASIKSDEYYVNMMIAWYIATSLAKQWDSTFPLIEKKALSKWVQNKSIQKAVESFRVSDEHKEILRKYKM